ncbi:alpha/beta fold hydrolase [Flavobacteriaceae bacterium]|nr:alpha/beta fold hydrolase [Flavobacteriaceae bacterium]MDC1195342.1 alpha/beta fold hydrolase [Flavobacteriaceae bacterium]
MHLHSNIIGEGHPFIILHGFLGMGDNWKTLAKQFSTLGFQVHLVDQRNHGRSFHDSEFNYEVLAEDLKAYCSFHNLEDIVLLGHSMGGKTAMLFAALHPEIVSKLIIADIAPRFYPVHHDAILEGLSALDFEAITSRKEAEVQLSKYVQDLGTRQFLLKNIYRVSSEILGLRINLETLKTNVSEVGEALPSALNFQKDSLFLRGDKSEYISVQDETLIKLQFPAAVIKTISNAGHWLHAENPTEFYHNVRVFIT